MHKKKSPSNPIPKITRPALPEVFIRPRLFKRLDRALNHAVAWICGPPGSGKTTLAASYLDDGDKPALWYQVDGGDADPATFFYYLGLAVKKINPRHRAPIPVLTPECAPGLEVFTRRFAQVLSERLRNGSTLVLDNYHAVAPASPFHEVIRALFDELAGNFQIIVMSRSEPPPSLARLRANQRLKVIGDEELRTTLAETRGIARLRHRLPDKSLRTLHEATNGWIAGIILGSQHASIGEPGDHTVPRTPVKEIFDYFAGEIFNTTDAELQKFLLKTSLFERITVSLAESLAGMRRGRRILDDLVRMNYFTERHGEGQPVYQYHALFRQFLVDRAVQTWSATTLNGVRVRAAKNLELAGQFEDAIELYRQAGDWGRMGKAVLQQAGALASQGRLATLETWLNALPASLVNDNPMLLYWRGICRLPFDPPLSRDCLERAFKQFSMLNDDVGSLLAWSGVVNTLMFEFDDLVRLDPWVSWLDERMHRDASFPDPGIEARVVCDMARILMYRRLDHTGIHSWMERALLLGRRSPDPNLYLQALGHVIQYFVWTGQYRAAGELLPEFEKFDRITTVAPFLLVISKLIEAHYMHALWAKAGDRVLKKISEALEISQASGVHAWDPVIYAHAVYACMNEGDLKTAGNFLSKEQAAMNPDHCMDRSHYHYQACLLALCRENPVEALHHAKTGIALVSQVGAQFPEALYHLAMAQAQHENGHPESAMHHLTQATEMSRRHGSMILEFACLLTEAQFAFDRGASELQSGGLAALRAALRLGREQGYITVPGWRPRVMTRLCLKALENDIERDYVTTIIRAHGLRPEDSSAVEYEYWPWPIRIYTLGRFNVVRDDVPLHFAKRGQEKVLELLKTLVAMGGRNVSEQRLAEALWPESDGDKAHQAFKTTAYRLRMLLGNENAISVRDGSVTLDSRYCWVDAYAFERLAGKSGTGTTASERAVTLYHGQFLEHSDESAWTMALRERLHAKYRRCLSRLGRQWEAAGEWQLAANLYEQGISVDPVAEEYYQKLMICHQQMGHLAEAVAVYRRCRKALAAHLDIEPSANTEKIFRSLQVEPSIVQKASAGSGVRRLQ